MSSRFRLKWLFLIIVVIGVIVVLAWVFVRRAEKSEEGEQEAVTTPSDVTIEKGERVVTFSKEIQARNGIVVAALEPVTHQEEVRAYGTVMELQGLIDMHNSYASAKAKLDEAQASLASSQKEYERLKTLYENNQNASEKAVQSAQATWLSSEATARAATVALNAQRDSTRQTWGKVLAQWLTEGTPSFQRLASQQDILIQLTLPPGTSVSSLPATACVLGKGGCEVSAKLVSPSPQTDPRIQGMSYFFLAPAEATNLLPRMNLFAYLAVGREIQGVIAPPSAVVWLKGQAWVFVQKAADQFVRREISVDTPVKDGWFVTGTLLPGERIVVSGAQLLLSEEFRSQIQSEG